MCMIIYKPKKATITKRRLRTCWSDNPNGAGFMFARNNKLNIHKGFYTFRNFYKTFRIYENRYKENFVIHFRLATHGKITTENCHPFYVNQNVGFCHNGILHCVSAPVAGDKSDTRVFCETTLQKLPMDFLNQVGYRQMLECIANSESSKFVFLTNRGTAHIFNEHAGTWDEGCWYSNNGYIERPKHHFGKFDFSLIDDDLYNDGFNKMEVQVQEDEWAECCWCGDYFRVGCEGTMTGGEAVCAACGKELEANSYWQDTKIIKRA